MKALQAYLSVFVLASMIFGVPRLALAECQTSSVFRPQHKLFQDLHQVALYVRVQPSFYEDALECKGKEAQCVEQRNKNAADFEQRKKKYIDDLKQDNLTYREPLHRDKLIQFFSEKIKKQIIPYVISTEKDCAAPSVIDLSTTGSKNFEKLTDKAATLVVFIKVRFIEDTAPKIAVIAASFYRPDVKYLDFPSQMIGQSTAIPLDLTDEEIQKRLEKFAKTIAVVTNVFVKD